jgi:hypothetical protein
MLEVVFFITIFTAIPLFYFINNIRNDIYGLFATIPAKDLTRMLSIYENLAAEIALFSD